MLNYLRCAVIHLKAYPSFVVDPILYFLCVSYIFINPNEVKHIINVIHKGISLSNAVECVLIEVQNEENKPLEFYMDVESVVCGDSRCRVDLVRIYWDQIGRYNRLELPNGIELEKAEGEDFTPDDYAKLDRILGDENSSLQEVYKGEIVSTVSGEGVDGMTGATVLVGKSAYVEGAVWTCYSLWHWTHGETKQIIRNITGDAHSTIGLQNFLQVEEYQNFAIEQLTRRKDFSARTIESLLQVIETNPALLETSMSYWKIAPTLIFEENLLQLIKISNSPNRLHCLNTALELKNHISQDFLQKLSTQLPKFTYQEIHLYLSLLKEQEAILSEIIKPLFLLLDHNDFLIARRIYWFLIEQELDTDQQEMLEKFYRDNENKL